MLNREQSDAAEAAIETRAGAGAESPGRSNPKRTRALPRGGVNPVSRALRTVYDDTLREEVPDDILRLLGKLE